MRAVQVAEPGGALHLVEREIPQTGPEQVRVRVQACGVCHSDAWAAAGALPATPHPIVLGHEIVGTLDEIGSAVTRPWQRGDRVGVGWFGGSCHHCESCRRGDFISRPNSPVPGITTDGGYADFVVVAADALASMPDELSATEAAPLLCAGVTTYHALRRSLARPGDRVAVLGVGGLGHLGIQFAARMGMEVIAISRGPGKAELARQLGAHRHIDSEATDPGRELAELGGAQVVLATAASGAAAEQMLPGLPPRPTAGARRGRRPAAGNAAVADHDRNSIVGHPSGTSKDSEDALRFSRLTGVRPMIETAPLYRAAEAYAAMLDNQARFCVVLTT